MIVGVPTETKPGGTPPICLPENIPVFVDKEVMKQVFVIGSAGSEFVGIKISPNDILKYSNARVVDVGEWNEIYFRKGSGIW